MKSRSYAANRCIDHAHISCYVLEASYMPSMQQLMQSQTEDTRLQDCEGMAELNFGMISNLDLSFLT